MPMRIDAVDPNLLQANIDMLQQQFGQRPMVPLQELRDICTRTRGR